MASTGFVNLLLASHYVRIHTRSSPGSGGRHQLCVLIEVTFDVPFCVCVSTVCVCATFRPESTGFCYNTINDMYAVGGRTYA